MIKISLKQRQALPKLHEVGTYLQSIELGFDNIFCVPKLCAHVRRGFTYHQDELFHLHITHQM